MFVVDASVWVSRYMASETSHEVSRAWIEACLDGGELLVAPSLLLPEVAGAVARRTGVSGLGMRAASLIARLPGIRLVRLDMELAPLSADMAAEHHLRGADAVYIALARRLGVPLVTWDREQREGAAGLLRAMTPEEIVTHET